MISGQKKMLIAQHFFCNFCINKKLFCINHVLDQLAFL